MNLGPYASYIWASYGMAALVIGGLLLVIVRDGRKQAAALADLEMRGIKRRSAEQ
jgi:heme exporter protein D